MERDPKMLNVKKMIAAMLFLAAVLMGQTASSAVQVTGRQIYILYPGLDSIWGSYLFMVQNTGSQPERFSFPVMLPAETIDFQGQDILGPGELKLGADGGLTIDKVFEPGDNLLNIGFKLPASMGDGPITLKATTAFDSIGLFVFEGLFTVSGDNLEIKKDVDFSGRRYDTYSVTNGELGKTYKFEVQGIPEGRGRLWIIGWIFGGALLLISFALAWFSRPQLPQGADDQL
jgi:hypothetical protein